MKHLTRIAATALALAASAFAAGAQTQLRIGLAEDPDVLDPRADTETLIGEALREDFISVLDLGTGTGAIAVFRRSISEATTLRGLFTPVMPVRNVVTRSLRGKFVGAVFGIASAISSSAGNVGLVT